MPTSSIRPIHFRRRTTSLPQRHPALFFINLTALHNSRPSTVPPSITSLTILLISKDPDPKIATLLQEGIPSGAFSQLEPVGLWETNSSSLSDYPDLVVCHDNWTSANHNPDTTRQLIQKELDDGFIEELPDIATAEQRWPKGIALGKLGVVHADNRDPRLVLDSTICGMNGRCHLPEKQRLPNLRHVSFFLSSCPPLQDEWQGASIDIKAAHKRMLIREDERGSLLFKFDDRLFAYRSAHFGAKTSAWHWGRVSGALLRLLHSLLYFRHAAWVYVDDFFLLFPKPTSAVQFTLAIILLRAIGAPLSWKKLEFDKTIDWNGWTIHPGTMIAQLPFSKQEKINSHYSSAPITFQEKPREDHRHSTLGYFTCPPCPLPTDLLVPRPLLYPSDKLQHQTNRLGIIPKPSQ